MFSSLDICNLALSWISGNQIMSFDDDSVEAEYCRVNYPISLQAVLESRAWTFASERMILLQSGEDPAFGSEFVYTIPRTVLKVHRVYDSDSAWINNIPYARWTREGNKIMCDLQTRIWCMMIMRQDDTQNFSTLFIHALAARIAADICIPVNQNRQQKEDMEAIYKDKLADAAGIDGSQGRTEKSRANTLARVRRI